MIAALFWKRSTKWGALASTLFVGGTLLLFALLQGPPVTPPAPAKTAAAPVAKGTNELAFISAANTTNAVAVSDHPATKPDSAKPAAKSPAGSPAPFAPPARPIWKIGEGKDATLILSLAANGDVRFLGGYMTVVPMVFGSAILMILFSLLTPPPSRKTIEKYFSKKTT
jgi:Na+/proline symporter